MKDAEISYGEIISRQKDVLRSPEANELLERTPSRLLRFGAWSVALLVILMLLLGIFIKYPDTLEGKAIITSDPLPIKLKSISGGRIAHMFVADGKLVEKNTVIAEIENPTGYENIRELQQSLNQINLYVNTNNNDALSAMLYNPLKSLGEVQGYYNQLLQQISARILLQKEQLYDKRTVNLEGRISKLRTIGVISQREKDMLEGEIKQAEERFNANEKLYKDKVISKQEYYDEAARLRQKKLQLEQLKANAMQNKVSVEENSRQILETKYEHQDKERQSIEGIRESMRDINNYIQLWQQRYLIIAPYKGVLNYLKPWQLNQLVSMGDEMFAIVPSEYKYIAIVMVPADGIGKMKKGQKVHLLVDNYPYNEFGFLEGVVVKWASIPDVAEDKATYRVYVSLKDSLVTNYNKKIIFNPEMTANARIITKDRNVLQRFFATIAKVNK
ncbi:MAG: HlyD family efflux transporter periplasmic adaptor subunit [Bacteroidetes bacterium]|nr:HlyD family efflux transporter periplasmic adaptor subunit [Bacteroidota bacterium]